MPKRPVDPQRLKSPCVNICQVDPSGDICLGCGRNLEEIAGWTGYTDAEREAVVQLAAARLTPPRTAPREPQT